MAIEMVENNELGALSQSRLGNKCFVDDEDYANFIFGKKRSKVLGVSIRGRKWHDEQRAKQVQQRGEWDLDPTKANDCNYLQSRLTVLQNTIEGRTGQAGKKYRTEAETRVLKGYETDYKNRIANLKCVEKGLAKEQEVQVQKNLELAKQVSNIPLPELMGQDTATPKSNLTKYILFGVGGLVLVITAIALLRRRN